MAKVIVHLRIRDHFESDEEYRRWVIAGLRNYGTRYDIVDPDLAEFLKLAADEMEK